MSEGSVSTTSSRIKQFGLYRTIDARTEEFLRLSRKRQIRQGCACAAVSTAITVTIVVGVILIYEYGIVSDVTPKTILRPNWLGLMNTSEAAKFEAKFNKPSINMDSSFQFLQLILKALKKNRYYDKIIEDDSSPKPPFEKKETSKDLFTTNIYSESRNLMPVPTSRFYAIEYKTSPIVLYKNPTRNTEYFTKIGRIRDYQRIMNYVDKMIKERITASTMGILKNSYTFDKKNPFLYTTPITSIKRYERKHNLQKKTKKIKKIKKRKCGCPEKINELLLKMITLLQKLLPNVTMIMPKPCDKTQKPIINDVTETSSHATVMKDDVHLKTIMNTLLQSMASSEVPKLAKDELKEAASLLKPHKAIYELNTIKKLIRPNKLRENVIISKDFNKDQSRTSKQSIESTEDYYFLSRDSTKSLPMLEKNINILPDITITDKVNLTDSRDLLSADYSDPTTKPQQISPILIKGEEDKYFIESTTPNIITNFPYLDIHTFELVKSKLIPIEKNNNTKTQNFDNKGSKHIYDSSKNYKNSSIIWGSLRKMGQIKISTLKPETSFDDYAEINNVIRGETFYKNWNSLQPVDSMSSYSTTIKYTRTSPSPSTRNNYLNRNIQDLSEYRITLDDEEDKMSYEEEPYFNNLKNLEKIINIFNNSITRQNNTSIKNNTQLNQSESISTEIVNSTEENIKFDIPRSRSSYLEIQRNDWKQEEREDYDNLFE